MRPRKPTTPGRYSRVKKLYNLSKEKYDSILEKQGYKCPGCGRRPRDVDHDHKCCIGRSSCGKCCRGILCHPCNMTLRYARDNPNTLVNLAEYLRNYQKSKAV